MSADLVRVFNKGLAILQHDSYKLLPGSFLDVPPEVAEIWLGIVAFGRNEVVLADSMGAGPSKPSANVTALVDENIELKQKLAELEKHNAGLLAMLEQSTAPAKPTPVAEQPTG